MKSDSLSSPKLSHPPHSRAIFPSIFSKASLGVLCIFLGTIAGCKERAPSGATIKDVQRTTDQTRLREIAVQGPDYEVRKAACQKITDQSMLLRIVLEDTPDHSASLAAGFIDDPAFLETIALEARDWDRRTSAAVELATLVKRKKIPPQELESDSPVLKAAKAFSSTLSEDTIYWRIDASLMEAVMPVIFVLADPRVVEVVGDVESVKVDYRDLKKEYYSGSKVAYACGQDFTCEIHLTKPPGTLRCHWVTQFPKKHEFTIQRDGRFDLHLPDGTKFVSSSDIPAEIRLPDLLWQVFERLPESLIEDILEENMNEDVSAAIGEWRWRHSTNWHSMEEYLIQDADSLSSIAGKFEISTEDLLEANRKIDANGDSQFPEIRAGNFIRIPNDRPGRYQIQGGDSISSIAVKFGVSTTDLKRVNRNIEIRSGNFIRIPNYWRESGGEAETSPSKRERPPPAR